MLKPVMRHALLVVLLILCKPAAAAPALWAVHGPHATVYLLGSMHLMQPNTPWQSPAITRAFDEAQECWFEVEMSGADNLMGAIVLILNAFDLSHRLSDRLSPQAWNRLGHMAGQNRAALDHLRPWLVATVLGAQEWLRAGFTTDAGIERVLFRRARASGKKVRGIETAAAQMRLLANMPDKDALASIEAVAETSDDTARIDRLLTLWLDGDAEAVAVEMAEMTQNSSPDFSARILTQRNNAFADAVSRLLTGDKTVLLTVGAFHMVGPDGVPALLERRGWLVERVYR